MRIGLAYVVVSFIACLGASYLGSKATPFISFFAIGLTMFLKDKLQLQHGWKWASFFVFVSSMFPIFFPTTQKVALASCTASMLSGAVDIVILELSGSILLSDFVSSLLDSFIFLKIAFNGGPFLIQSIVKFFGTRLWRLIAKKVM